MRIGGDFVSVPGTLIHRINLPLWPMMRIAGDFYNVPGTLLHGTQGQVWDKPATLVHNESAGDVMSVPMLSQGKTLSLWFMMKYDQHATGAPGTLVHQTLGRN